MTMDSGMGDFARVAALLAASIVAVPLARRLGLGSVIGYLSAGLVIGPFGFALFADPQAILHVAELGIVMFLFVVGLEMQPSHLWSMRKRIFGLGTLQVAVCGAVLTGLGILGGLKPAVAFVVGMGFVLTSTAIVMQILEERGVGTTEPAERVIAILLLEDLAIVPLLAVIALLVPAGAVGDQAPRWEAVAIGIGTVGALVVAGVFFLNPMFSLLAKSGSRETMTAAALLVVLGAALMMQLAGLSMAMGAFAAGVLLSESSFRRQLETEIEPFRGLLLGLFFLGVGMALDLDVIAAEWRTVLVWTVVFMVAKSAAIYAVARFTRAPHREATYRAALMAQGGEFAFVLFATALDAGILDARTSAVFTTVVIASMALTPLVLIAVGRLLRGDGAKSMEGVESAHGLDGSVLLIGFGRFGQVAAQSLLVQGTSVSIIDNDPDMIRAAETFGFKVWFGDGTRLDVLKASGAARARAICVCIDKPEQALAIAELARAEFPLAKVLVRAYDRGHAIRLVDAGVQYQVRETFESAMAFGEATLRAMGVPAEEAVETAAAVRQRDAERLALQQAAGDVRAGRDLIRGNVVRPAPLVPVVAARKPIGVDDSDHDPLTIGGAR